MQASELISVEHLVAIVVVLSEHLGGPLQLALLSWRGHHALEAIAGALRPPVLQLLEADAAVAVAVDAAPRQLEFLVRDREDPALVAHQRLKLVLVDLARSVFVVFAELGL